MSFESHGPATKLKVIRKQNGVMVTEYIRYSKRDDAINDIPLIEAQRDVETVRIVGE